MGKCFAQTTQWVALVALLFPGLARAEETPANPNEETNISDATSAATSQDDETPKKTSLFRHSTYPAAWKAAQKTNRPILVYVCMPNCPHCVKMREQTYELPKVERLVSGSFESIRADRFTHTKLVKKLDVKWYPTTVLVSPNNKVLDVIEGYVDAKPFQRRLQTGLATLAPPTQTR